MRIIGILGSLLVLMSTTCMAADAPKVSLDAKDMTIDQAMADLSKQASVQIVCESDAKGTVNGSFSSMDLDKLMDIVTKSNSLKWQKFYVPAPKNADEPKLTVEQIKARAAAVAAATGTIIVCDPVTGKQKVFVEQDAKAPSVEPDKLGMKVIYVVSKPKAEVKDTEKSASSDAGKKFQALADERMDMLKKMTPQEREAAMQKEMLQMMNLDPGTRQQMMLSQMNARQNMDPQLRDQYQQMMRDTFQQMRDSGLLPQGGFGGRGQGGQGGNGGQGRGNRGNRGNRGGGANGGTVQPAQ